MIYYLTCGHCGEKFLNSVTHYCENAEKQAKFFMDFLQNPKIKEIRTNGCATIIWFFNGEKTVAKCQEGDTWRYDLGILFAWANYHRKKKRLFSGETVLTKQQQQVIKNSIKKSTENFKEHLKLLEKQKTEGFVDLMINLKTILNLYK